MKQGIIKAVCISPQMGTEKENVHQAQFKAGWGIEKDAHAGEWHRQVSLLSFQKVQEFNLLGACVSDGAFGENLLVDGIDCASLPVGAILRCGDVVLEVGIFARVLAGGQIKEGDIITAEVKTEV